MKTTVKGIEKRTFKNVEEILKEVKLTANEVIFIKWLNEILSGNFREDYSDRDCNDAAKDLHWNVAKVKGIVGSLVKKYIISTYDTGTGYEVIIFRNQENMDYINVENYEVK